MKFHLHSQSSRIQVDTSASNRKGTKGEEKKYSLYDCLFSPPNLICWPLLPLPFYKGKDFGPRLIWCRFTAFHLPVLGTGQEPHPLCVRVRPPWAAAAKESWGWQVTPQGSPSLGPTNSARAISKYWLFGPCGRVGKGTQRNISCQHIRHLHLKLREATLVRLRPSFQGCFTVQINSHWTR